MRGFLGAVTSAHITLIGIQSVGHTQLTARETGKYGPAEYCKSREPHGALLSRQAF